VVRKIDLSPSPSSPGGLAAIPLTSVLRHERIKGKKIILNYKI